MRTVADRVAVVKGAASGIGRTNISRTDRLVGSKRKSRWYPYDDTRLKVDPKNLDSGDNGQPRPGT